MSQTNLVWFRNDLRVYDNPALSAACQQQARVFAVFCWAEKQWRQHGHGDRKIDFIHRNLVDLQQELNALNIPLLIINCDKFSTISKYLLTLCKQHQIDGVFFNREYELNERQRDEQATTDLRNKNIKVHCFDEQVLIAPDELMNKQDGVYHVFTPYKKAWISRIEPQVPSVIHKPPKRQQMPRKNDPLPKNTCKVDENSNELWPAGAKHAQHRLSYYCKEKVSAYKDQRDFPGINATSQLSPYLSVGAISQKQCLLKALAVNNNRFASGNAGVVCWISELVWREFYRYITYHYPHVCRYENFREQYDQIAWRDDQKGLDAWLNGETGVPIVDAAIRQLLTTGWMHNRCRMIVAMFLTKNLLIDWREGEYFFMQELIDGDFCSNNGGWQWSASTGTDAAPYFRIFNPVSQSERFDADGQFIRTFCPELTELSNKHIHDPTEHLSRTELKKIGYPQRIVDLKATRARAIEAFKQVTKK